MKRVVLLLLLAAICSSAQARVGEDFWLLKAGVTDVQERASSRLGSLGVLWGYNMSYRVAFEAQLDQSVAGGNYRSGSGNISLTALQGAFAYRHGFGSVFYGKARLGLAAYHVAYKKEMPYDDLTSARLVPSLGLGVVLHNRIGRRLIAEVDYSFLTPMFQSLNFGLSLKY